MLSKVSFKNAQTLSCISTTTLGLEGTPRPNSLVTFNKYSFLTLTNMLNNFFQPTENCSHACISCAEPEENCGRISCAELSK